MWFLTIVLVRQKTDEFFLEKMDCNGVMVCALRYYNVAKTCNVVFKE